MKQLIEINENAAVIVGICVTSIILVAVLATAFWLWQKIAGKKDNSDDYDNWLGI